eukprot:14278286-Alexandrium_andersonii.AAC.1
MLSSAGQYPTFLHSTGNAVAASPCGCRAGPISPSMLANKGLRGGLWQEGQALRFPTPDEAMAAMGFPAQMPSGTADPRFALCAIGNAIPAPLA